MRGRALLEKDTESLKAHYLRTVQSSVLALSRALDEKYGDCESWPDLRRKDTLQFTSAFDKASGGMAVDSKILLCGTSVCELKLLKLPTDDITVLDLSKKVLSRVKENHPNINVVLGDANCLPFASRSFDFYISLRTIQSYNIDTRAALEEGLRVIDGGGKMILSVPNGYLMDGKVVKGLYQIDKKEFSLKAPYLIIREIENFFESKNVPFETVEVESEIFIRTL